MSFYFLSNNLFTLYTLEEEFPKLYDFTQDLSSIFEDLSKLYDSQKFSSQNEHQFEDDFISKTLELLGWQYVRQDEKIIQGKLEKPDFLLFASQEDKENYLKIPKKTRHSSNDHIAVILESKDYNIPIDNKKIKDNPHFQILRYLNNLKLDFGFLTNGRYWRFYDNSKLSSQKIFYEINLEAIIQRQDLEAFKYFYFIFNAQNFTQQQIQTLIHQDTLNKTKIEDDLKSIIYGINGYNSTFEKIGICLYEKHKETHTLDEIYQNSLYFIFRLLFIAYFEDKFEEILANHSCYNAEISLHHLIANLDINPQSFTGFSHLNRVFKIFNEGEPNLDMPIFNGGLFDPSTAPLLSTPKLFSNSSLKEILESLFFTQIENKRFKRDYKTLSITHLGSIYEGILSYFFEVAQEDIYYILYTEGKNSSKSVEGYFDSYDFELLKKKHKNIKATLYKKGQIYLKNTSNSRKSTASFYTPQSLTSYLVSHSIQGKINDKNILTYKILDNACGSGHFLVSALNFITQEVIERFDTFPSFKQIYDQEAASIRHSTAQYISNYQIDESDIIKRLLLKRMIYGIDLNPFSVELTKLSLWIDSFIFGTPLSFIEHHIKCGNALVGSSIQDFRSFYHTQSTQDLFMQDFMSNFHSLSQVFHTLNELKDSTEEEIKQSKEIYRTQIAPTLNTLNQILDFHTALDFLSPQERLALKGKELDILESIAAHSPSSDCFGQLASKYRFFHYEIAFPEVFVGDKKGFDCIIGNPPWDKTKLSDDDFFPQFISDYRSKKASQKKQIALDLLAKPHIKALYNSQKSHIDSLNNYYKSHYPLNRGSGDGNLFRFFTERNLSLLAPNAPLSYVLPSALMFEEGSYALRRFILEEKSLQFFLSFENREGIFPDVDSRYKFALMQVDNTPPSSSHQIKTLFYLTKPEELENEFIPLSLESIRSISPTQLALPEIRDYTHFQILQKLYQAFPTLSLSWMDFRRELDMTNDKDLFIEEEREGLLPLYEGKMIHQNNASFSQATYFLDPHAFDERLRSKELHRLKGDLGMNGVEFEKFCKSKNLNPIESIVYDREFIRLGFRGIARDTDERTAIFSLLPVNCGFGHSMFGSTSKTYLCQEKKIKIQTLEIEKILFALGVFNSLVVDFIVRGIVQINVSKTYLERIPLPQPSVQEIHSSPLYATIARNALALQRYNDKEGYFKALDSLFGSEEKVQISKHQSSSALGGAPLSIPQTEKSYLTLKAQTDILIAKLYKITKEEFETILKSFKVLHTKQPHYIKLLLDLWDSVGE